MGHFVFWFGHTISTRGYKKRGGDGKVDEILYFVRSKRMYLAGLVY